MYFADVLKVLLRRWYVVVAGMVIMIAAAGAAIVLVPTQYQASGQLLLLLPPEASGEGTPTNPLLNMQDGLIVTATLIAGNASSSDTQKDMVDAGFASEYSVSLSPGAGPLLVISASGSDPIDATATRDEIVKRLKDDLAGVQANPGIPSRLIISANDLSMTSEAEVLPGSKIRALAVIAAIGVITTLVVAFTVDRRPENPKRGTPENAKSRTPRRSRKTKEQPTAPAEAKAPEIPGGDRPGATQPGPRRRSIQLAPRTSAGSR